MYDYHQTNRACELGCVCVWVCVCVWLVCISMCVYVCGCVCLHAFPDSEPAVWDAFQPRNHHLLPKLRARQSCTFRWEGGLILLRNPQLHFQQWDEPGLQLHRQEVSRKLARTDHIWVKIFAKTFNDYIWSMSLSFYCSCQALILNPASSWIQLWS